VVDITPVPGRPGRELVVRCRALDGSGAPLAGVRVSFSWRLPEGDLVDRRITGSDGLAVVKRVAVGALPGDRVKVRVGARYSAQTVWRDVALAL
jgi:hypothetical protein